MSRMDKKQEKVTIDVVARKSGFSRATVSRVINRDPSVKPSTAEKIQRVIDALGYTPHIMASALSGGKTKTLGILLPELANEYYTLLLAGADATAEEHGTVSSSKPEMPGKIFWSSLKANG